MRSNSSNNCNKESGRSNSPPCNGSTTTNSTPKPNDSVEHCYHESIPTPTPPTPLRSPQVALLISGTSSGVGKTTITIGLMAAFAARGYNVQPFKCGPDFLDGMHHEAAVEAGSAEYQRNKIKKRDATGEERKEMKDEVEIDADAESSSLEDEKQAEIGRSNQTYKNKNVCCVNLDSWMMGSTDAMISSYQRHSIGADICIIEGCMGLHDSKDGTSEIGSTAHIAKLLNVPVVLIIDGSMMARSTAAMALGYTLLDENMRMGAVIVNKVGGRVHRQWIKESIEKEGEGDGRLKDVGTGRPVMFAGALPNDMAASMPERHLGLTMPSESDGKAPESRTSSSERYLKLAALVEENLDLEALLELGRTSIHITPQFTSPELSISLSYSTPSCRIGIAQDAAFCFYYRDNLHLLQLAGAQLIPFSPLTTPHLPSQLDGIYMGGGYPELHAAALERNVSLRRDIKSFSEAGGVIYAECGGMMYLADKIYIPHQDKDKDKKGQLESRNMCGVFPIAIRMTPHAKMYYAEVEFAAYGDGVSIFPKGGKCRGQRFHFSEVVEDNINKAIPSGKTNEKELERLPPPLLVTPLLPGAEPEYEGFSVRNTVASYFHLHFSSYREGKDKPSSSFRTHTAPTTIAEHFLQAAVTHSPHRKSYAVSFVSAATEIIFALGTKAEMALAGVTSVCDYPLEAQYAPRQIVCRSPMDASSMTSEEVEEAMKVLKSKRNSDGPPGHWLVDAKALATIQPKIAFVQNTCDICDASADDVLYALDRMEEEKKDSTNRSGNIDIIQVAPTTLEGTFEAIETIASALNVTDQGEEVILSYRSRLQRIESEVNKLHKTQPRPTVLSLEGLAPLCTGGHWLPDLKYASGCKDALGDKGGCAARIITWEEILTADPDILVLSPCSASPARTLSEIHLLASTSEFWKMRCVQRGHVYIFDHGCFSRSGPRLIEGVEMMAALFRNILPMEQDRSRLYEKWSKDALKYECRTEMKEDCNENCNDNDVSPATSHCTTELASRFRSCFKDRSNINIDVIENSSFVRDKKVVGALEFCHVTRCTIPGSELPFDRSAHCIIPVHRRKHKQLSLLLFGGESQNTTRLDDTWELHAPAHGWSALRGVCSVDKGTDKEACIPKLGTIPTWEKLTCGKVAGEDVPTPRSNHAMVACGEHILVFGGWSVDNMTPLSHCELLHSDTLCWTHCSTRGSIEPGPRGNPSLVYRRGSKSAVLFGGWNGIHALNDLWYLDMDVWQWHNISQERPKSDLWPTPRTDHTAVLWEASEEKEIMLVFGGNIEGVGPSSELWALGFSTGDGKSSRYILDWHQVKVTGPNPQARTSHTAAIVGKANSAKMIIVGGTNSERGTGPGSMLCDAWVLHLAADKHVTQTWIKLDWSGSGLDRCRHSMSAVDENTLIWWGGYDGAIAVDDGIGIWRGDLRIAGEIQPSTGTEQELISDQSGESEKHTILQERWAAEVPVREEDLPREVAEKASRSRLPGALYKAIHRHAVALNRDTYIDPASGYSVFSSVYLKRSPCCGNGCRHCPHGHVNVPGRKHKVCNDKDLDW